jgi:hypothetical protein
MGGAIESNCNGKNNSKSQYGDLSTALRSGRDDKRFGWCGGEQMQTQIPFGNDNKKGNGNSKNSCKGKNNSKNSCKNNSKGNSKNNYRFLRNGKEEKSGGDFRAKAPGLVVGYETRG